MKAVGKSVIAIALVAVFAILCSFIKYHDISSYDMVSGIAIDYENNVWTVTCEICLPSSSDDFASKAEYVKSKSFTLEKALNQAGLESSNMLYTESVQLYLINEEASKQPQLIEFLLSSKCNLRAVAVLVKGKATDVIASEKESNQRAKSLSLADKIKNLSKDFDCDDPHVMTFVKGKTGIVISEEGVLKKRGVQ